MARILIVGGGRRGRWLGASLVAAGHAVRITTRTEAGRPAIEAAGAECFVGTPDRVASLRYALEGVAVVCWLLGTVDVPALHGARLEAMLGQIVDSTVRGFVYEGTAGAPLVAARAGLNAIPHRLVDADPEAWFGTIVELL
jgi:nucleoside-diphosphate-sugar epimerase